jgi:adenylate cyclase
MTTQAGPRERVRALIEDAERSAEISAGVARMVSAGVLAVALAITATGAPLVDRSLVGQYSLAFLTISGFFLLGVASVILARSRYFDARAAFWMVALDGAFIAAILVSNLTRSGLSADFLPIFPTLWLIPLLLAGTLLRFRPAVQIFALVSFLLALVFAALQVGFTDVEGRNAEISGAARLLAPQPNGIRLVMLALTGAILVLAAARGRTLLEHGIRDAEARAALTRFLPAEIVPVFERASIDDLRRGRRQQAVVMFVDIRDSTARAETLDPARLSIFISSFRRRVMRAAQDHDAVVDKFVGDGALLVFGLPEPRPDDAARAVRCARQILDLVERWNRKRQFDPPVRVGIGLHLGEVYVGVVGDETRLEFTVLGDTVNVAARLEQATKTYGPALLASAETVSAAGKDHGWHEIAREPLRGRTHEVIVMAPDNLPGLT